jgi:transposase
VFEKYIVHLEADERQFLKSLISSGKTAAYKIQRAHILLKSDASASKWTANRCAEAFSCHSNTVLNIKKHFVERGLKSVMQKKQKPSQPKIVDGETEARIIALSCSKPPAGYSQWSLRLLAKNIVELQIVESISYETVRQTLKKTNLSPICGNVG